MELNEEVALTLADGAAVVALESNVVAQGLPYPRNHETALQVEDAARGAGAVPATIAVIDGVVRVGLSRDELERIALSPSLPKLTTRDIGACVARRGTGATTIAATMAIADLAGIAVVASAGLGGVHRDASESFDISADLPQLTRSKVLVVSAGAKKILDVPATLEYLETAGVPVVGYRCDDFPAFYCVSSGSPVPHRSDSLTEVAQAALAHWSLGNAGAVLVAHPISPSHALESAEVDEAIESALLRARAEGISGQRVTRYLLDAVNDATHGRAQAANAAVLISTTEIGAQAAVAYSAVIRRALT
ncbi:pseudouridine-5'-phosphate glycosidase [Clavibacter michiganensis]|uniref:Pseudouridine-5'-phosphate glycosidase n=1 Tax=Clavibacter michiganensis subsp. insidiosus TaxID=33014 RepID=A0A0D5CHF0_9MICO|nr:pseudouridine-5'-phosphate glycosidase [Clavibacter michiganensis]AJW78705.1 pseudouridine-5'-phosphate glycosidase [Clavibacter michiganensis subsp. insidiosus]AWF98633.1 pseudouridine-5'-phosphate glycosidase [Clavibacter michiganensis subsp. insidiosus]AWG01151.1 pseudouridine-5'-phosphate glycosidase [Clavibacter michiganensis subsp. insidiosus]OQJ60288.1 pseudouridine-5'-phosphate glycosidase [Clavibacter michiganensis subsp. insidiosus]RII88776.1 pseudouridine-5'-phosphate glycosidase